jgi:hypothetical protein
MPHIRPSQPQVDGAGRVEAATCADFALTQARSIFEKSLISRGTPSQ